MDIQLSRMQTYTEDHCWQYDIRLRNLEEDLKLLPAGTDYTTLRVKDFTFKPLITESDKRDAINFIRRHEWLGDIALNTTHYFGA